MSADFSMDYEQVIKQAKNMSKQALTANEKIIQAYKKMDQMKDNWGGTAYNKVVQVANSYIGKTKEEAGTLYGCFYRCVSLMPQELAGKAKAAAKADMVDGADGINIDVEGVKRIEEITKSTVTGFSFKPKPVESAESEIKALFKEAKTYLDSAMTFAEQANWTGNSAATNKQTFKVSINTIKNILDKIQTTLSALILEQKASFEAQEKINAAVKAGTDIKETLLDGANMAADKLKRDIQDAANATWETLSNNPNR